ncbi:MAG: hypothetical protein ACI9N9_000078 [Enterobacterales bacterium]|jgi:hypothetical protein
MNTLNIHTLINIIRDDKFIVDTQIKRGDKICAAIHANNEFSMIVYKGAPNATVMHVDEKETSVAVQIENELHIITI